MNQKICIAVVGCGRIATNGHFPAFRALSDMVRVKYACDLIESKAALKQKEYPELVENVITDYKIARGSATCFPIFSKQRRAPPRARPSFSL